MAPHTGLTARIELVVTEADTAEAFRSGTVPVLATPRLLALCEEAAAWPSTGTCPTKLHVGGQARCNSTIWRPVGIGGIVWAEATLDRIEGRRLVFTLSASERAGLVARGQADQGDRRPRPRSSSNVR